MAALLADLPARHGMQAIKVSMSSGAYATDSQLAEHYYRLGELLLLACAATPSGATL